MTIIRIDKSRENPFVMMDKRPINDDRLSWKAKGLLAYFLSKPNNWQIWVNDLIKRAKDGESSVRSGLKELMEVGYLKRGQKQHQNGTFLPMEYVVYEVPLGDFPQADKPQADNPHVENQVHTKNDLTENELTNKDGNPPAQTSLLGEPPQPKPQPDTNSSPQQPQATDPATPGGQPGRDTLTEAQSSSVPAPPLHAGDTSSAEPPACVPTLDDLPVLSVVVGYPDPPATSAPPADPPVKRNYVTDLFTYANRKRPGDSDTHIRPKHWETVSDDEYAICKRVADLWCGGRLPFPGSIEAHCGAAGYLLNDLHSGNLSACIRALDEYHEHYEAERMSFTVAGPKSLVAVLPAFLAQGGGDGEPGVIRLGG